MSNDWEAERRSLQEGVSLRTVQFEMLEETYQQAAALAKRNGWTEEGALLIVFSNGLALLNGEASLTRIQRADLPQEVEDELNRLLRQVQEESSRSAVLKFRAYRMSQDNDALSMREAALRGELKLATYRLTLFRQDEAALKQRLSDLEGENAELRGRLAAPASAEVMEVATRPRRLLQLRRRLSGRWFRSSG
jgi:hypothetical protein